MINGLFNNCTKALCNCTRAQCNADDRKQTIRRVDRGRARCGYTAAPPIRARLDHRRVSRSARHVGRTHRERLRQPAARLANADWLDAAFSAGDPMTASLLQVETLRILKRSNLAADVVRAEARPA
jgi:hypothetical protein